MAVHREVLYNAVFNGVDAVFVPDIFPLLNNEFFVRQRPRTGHVSRATLNPRKTPFSLAIAVTARAVAESRLNHEALGESFTQGVAQISKIHTVSQPVQTKRRRHAVRAVVPEYE